MTGEGGAGRAPKAGGRGRPEEGGGGQRERTVIGGRRRAEERASRGGRGRAALGQAARWGTERSRAKGGGGSDLVRVGEISLVLF